MAITINGTTGISGVDGSAATPALQGADTNTGISFGTDTVTINTGGVARVTTDASGNVGIGTSSPATKLHVSGTGSQELRLTANTSGDIRLGFDVSGVSYNWIDAYRASGSLAFATGNSERMRIDSSGSVGIGTASPQAKTHIYTGASGTTYTGYISQLRVENNGDAGVILFSPTANKAVFGHATPLDGGSAAIVMDGTNRYLAFCTVNGAERGRFDSSGNLLIGTTTNPLGKLTVSGSVAVGGQDYAYYARSGSSTSTGFISGAGGAYSIWASDRVSASEFNARSDARLKKDVAGITAEDAFAFIENVPAVHYKWIKGGDNGVKFGYLAQDVIKAGFPNLIGQYPDESLLAQTDEDGFTSPNGFMLTVNYDQVIPILSRAISALKAELDSVKAELVTLKGAA